VLTRSLATSFSTLAPVTALMFFGGETLQDFAFALLIGVASGAYSSIFIAAPVVTLWKEREPVYVRRRRMILEENGFVPPFAADIIGEDGRLVPDETAPSRAGRRRAPTVAAAAQPATAAWRGTGPTAAKPPASAGSDGGNGDGATSPGDAEAAARKAKRAQNRARKRHGRR
jgi:SecD/SecF fusion protein